MAGFMVEVLTGTVVAFVGLPDLVPLPWWQTLSIFAYAMVACLLVNDTIKMAMIRWWLHPALSRMTGLVQ
jgi:H+-transporting ATPase